MLEEKPSTEGDRSEKPPPGRFFVSCGKSDYADEPIEYGHGMPWIEGVRTQSM